MRHKRGRSLRLGKGTLLSLAVIIVALLGAVITFKYARKKSPPPVPTSEWRRYSPGNSIFSLLLPGEPQTESVKVPEPVRAKVKQIDRFKLSAGEFQVAVWATYYVEGMSADIRQAADSAVSSFRESPGITDYIGNTNEITRSGRSGMLVTGTFKRRGERMAIEAILLGDGPRLWQVIVTCPASDRDASTASRRVLDSVKIEE